MTTFSILHQSWGGNPAGSLVSTTLDEISGTGLVIEDAYSLAKTIIGHCENPQGWHDINDSIATKTLVIHPIENGEIARTKALELINRINNHFPQPEFAIHKQYGIYDLNGEVFIFRNRDIPEGFPAEDGFARLKIIVESEYFFESADYLYTALKTKIANFFTNLI
jgi:hypothetical protein